MLKYITSDIVFQEIPDEVTLAIDITNCPFRCKGCHSPFLWEDKGTPLNEESLKNLIAPYAGEITCVSFMGGDREPSAVASLARFVKEEYAHALKTAWYSGNAELPSDSSIIQSFEYLKTGPYIAEKGPLRSSTTNQRMYRIHPDGTKEDITSRFWIKGMPDADW